MESIEIDNEVVVERMRKESGRIFKFDLEKAYNSRRMKVPFIERSFVPIS